MPIPLSSDFEQNSGLPLNFWGVVADITARDAIPNPNRYDGLETYIIATNETWQLQGGITNADWVLVTNSGGSSDIEIGVTDVLSGTPNSILYIDPGGKLGQDNPNFTYDEDTQIMKMRDNVTLALGNGGLSGDLGADMIIYSDGTFVNFKIESPTGSLDSTNPYLSFQYFDVIGAGVYTPFIYFGRNAGFGGGLDGFGGFAHNIYLLDIYNHAVDGAFIIPDRNYPSVLKYGEVTYHTNSGNVRMFHSDALNEPFSIDGSGHYSFGSLLDEGSRVNAYPTASMHGITVKTPSSYSGKLLRAVDSSNDDQLYMKYTSLGTPLFVIGKPTSDIETAIGFLDPSALIFTGNGASILAISNEVGSAPSITMGNDASQTMAASALATINILGKDDVFFSVQNPILFLATEDWTTTGNGFDTYLGTCTNGETSTLPVIILQEQGSTLMNASNKTNGFVFMKGSDGSYVFTMAPATKRVGINNDTPDFALDVRGDIRIHENEFFNLGGIGATPAVRIEGYELGHLFIFRSVNGTYNHHLLIGLDQSPNIVSIGTEDFDHFINVNNRLVVAPNANDSPSSVIFLSGTHLSFPFDQAHTNPGEYTLQQEDFPIFYRATGDTIEVMAFLTFAADDSTKRVRMYFGSTVAYDTGDVIQNDGTLSMRMTVNCLSDSSQQVCVDYLSNGTLIGSGATYNAASEDLTNEVNIKVTSECDNNGGVVIHSFRILFYPIF